jgi:hypothetical protein
MENKLKRNMLWRKNEIEIYVVKGFLGIERLKELEND